MSYKQTQRKKKPFKLGLFFTNTEKDYNKSSASTWIRIWQMIEVYEQQGIAVSFNNPFKRYDAAIVFRKSKPKYYWILRYLKLISKTVYFDTCINLFEENEEISSKRLKCAIKIGKKADGIISASHQISRYSAPYTKSTFALEDPINLDHFKTIKSNINFNNPIFGWSGVGRKTIFLNHFANEIDKNIILISEENIHKVKLDFRFTYIKWEYEKFPNDILKCDIAILPRDISCSYNRGHSSFKALVFAVLGIPIIANKIPSYVDLSHFYDGIVFLEDFENSIQKCITKLKTKSLDTRKVRTHYSRENQASLLFQYLKATIEKA